MRRKISLILALAIIVSSTLFAQSKKDTLPSFIGVSYIPALNWKVFHINNNDGASLEYKFNQNAQSSFEGNFAIRPIGIRFGLSANIENNFIGKAYQYAGYINIKNYWLKIQSTKVSGTFNWVGEVAPGFFTSRDFSNKYFDIELLKTSGAYKHMAGGSRMMGTYWGLGYTSLGFPLKISTLITPGGRENQKFGKAAYDTLFTAKIYSACFGFDLLRQLCLTSGKIGAIPGKPAIPFGMYASTQDKIGFGMGKISNYGKSMAEALNPGLTFVDSEGFTSMIRYDLSVGFRYYRIIRPIFLLFAVGYDFDGAAILDFGGAADTNKDLGYETNFFYLNHGVSFKLYISLIGNN